MTKKQIKTITCALFHDGIDIEKLSEAAKVELRDAVKILLAAHYGHEHNQSPKDTEGEMYERAIRGPHLGMGEF